MFRYVFDEQIKIVHLFRNYFDVYVSYFSRGGVNMVIEERLDEHERDNTLIQAIGLSSARKLHEIEYDSKNVLAVSPAPSVRILANLFYNDLLIKLVSKKSRRDGNYFPLAYDEIKYKSQDISEFIDSGCGAGSLNSILMNPVTRKLPDIDTNEMSFKELIIAVSTLLDEYMNKIVIDEISPESFFVEDERGISSLYIPKFREVILTEVSRMNRRGADHGS